MPYRDPDSRRECQKRSNAKRRDKRLATRRRWYAMNQERERERSRKWKGKNYQRIRNTILARVAVYYQKNKSEIRAKVKSAYAANPEPFRESAKRSYQNNKANALARTSKWQRANPEKVKAIKRKSKSTPAAKQKIRAWYLANKDRLLAMQKERERNDPRAQARYRTNCKRRRALQKGSTIGDLKEIERFYTYVLTAETVTCRYCQTPIPFSSRTIDHFIPLSRGGPHSLQNLVPACKPCNSSKCAKTGADFIAWLNRRHHQSAA